MAGLDAALASVTTPVVVVLATDLPLVGTLPERLVRALDDTSDTHRVGRGAGRRCLGAPAQLCAAYRTDALRRAIAAGGGAHGASMHGVVGRLHTSTVNVMALREVRGETVEFDPTWDIDTPEDLHRLEALLTEDRPTTEGELMDQWVDALTRALELPSAVDTDTLLDVARDVAHNVERRATPVTTYLWAWRLVEGWPPRWPSSGCASS